MAVGSNQLGTRTLLDTMWPSLFRFLLPLPSTSTSVLLTSATSTSILFLFVGSSAIVMAAEAAPAIAAGISTTATFCRFRSSDGGGTSCIILSVQFDVDSGMGKSLR